MASSSVSQDDIDNDFEKNNRRSRIRTARARQINPSGCRVESNNMVDQQQIDVDQLGGDEGGASNGALTQPSGGAGGVSSTSSNAINKYDKLMAAPEENAEHETSPKPIMRGGGRKEEKRPNKMHHSNKGKQQRDRRKLREKRRSTGVVHLASTESTGGSTTGDDEESSDQQPGVDRVLLETKRNTHQNESIANSYRQAQEKLGFGDSDSLETNGACSLYPTSLASFPPRVGKSRRDKSPSDLEADDENDHDSLNQSEAGSTLSLSGTTTTTSTATCSLMDKSKTASTSLTNSNTPIVRPTTPTGELMVEDFSRVVEENKRLHSMLEEKDRRIHLLEYKVNQLIKDTLTISEDNARYQKENSTLVRALSTLSSKEPNTK